MYQSNLLVDQNDLQGSSCVVRKKHKPLFSKALFSKAQLKKGGLCFALAANLFFLGGSYNSIDLYKTFQKISSGRAQQTQMMGLDKIGFDKIGFDKIGLDEMEFDKISQGEKTKISQDSISKTDFENAQANSFSAGFSLSKYEQETAIDFAQRYDQYDQLENRVGAGLKTNADNIAKPKVLDSLIADKEKYVVVINKETQQAQVYKLEYLLVDQTEVSTGINPGEKQISGDHKTPTGVYDILSVEKSSEWIHSGRFAYGPYFARLSCGSWDSSGNYNPDGWSQIGMHGTDEPEKLGNPASEGCVRLGSRIMQEYVLSEYIRKGTKVVILDNAYQLPANEKITEKAAGKAAEKVAERIIDVQVYSHQTKNGGGEYVRTGNDQGKDHGKK